MQKDLSAKEVEDIVCGLMGLRPETDEDEPQSEEVPEKQATGSVDSTLDIAMKLIM